MLTPKQQLLLKALSQTEYRTSESLGKTLNLSSKTVRTMLKELRPELEACGAELQAKSRRGFLLKVTDRERFEKLGSDLSPEHRFIPATAEERVYYLLVLLLCQVDYIKLDDICQEIFVSKYTVTGDLHRVELLLADYNLQIHRRPNYGLRVEGRESDIRNCIAHTLGNYSRMMPDGGAGYQGMTHTVSNILLETVQTFDLHLSEINFRNLVNIICASIHRILLHCPVILQDDAEQNLRERTHAEAEYLVTSLTNAFHVMFSENEKLFLALNIAGKCNYSCLDMNDQNVVVEPALDKLAVQMLDSINDTFKLTFKGNFLLRMALEQHLVAMDIRLRYSIPVENPLLKDVQKQYPFAYILAEQAAIPLRHHYQATIPEDEIGYLAFIFQLALEQERSGFSKKNILVVCVAGMASARLISYRLKEEYSKYLDNIYICDYYRLESFDLSKVDYIFTSLPIRKKVNIPIVQVDDFFDTVGARVVREILEDSSVDFLASYFRPELFFPHLDGKTKERAIANLCEHVSKVISLPDGFLESVLKREELARTDFFPLVAFPHSYKVFSDETFVAVGILDEPIQWVRNDVQVLLLISIADQENPELQKFYMTTTNFMQDTKRVKSLIQYRDFSWLLQLLCGEHKTKGRLSPGKASAMDEN